MSPSREYTCLTLFLILLFTAISRFYGVDRLGLWADELWVVMDSSQGSLWDLLRTVHYQDNHPPGYYLLSRFSQLLLGTSDFAIRLPSALAGIALVWTTFSFGQRFFSIEAGMIAAALVAGSYQAIYYSQEARPNIFLALFCLLALQSFITALYEGTTARKWPWEFWVWASLAAWFHYAGLVFVLVLGALWLYTCLDERTWSQWKNGLTLFLPLLLLYLPWLPSLYYDLTASPTEAWQRTPDLQTLAKTFLFLFGPGDLRVLFYAVSATAATLLVSATAILPRWRDSRETRVAGILWLVVVLPIACFYFKSLVSQSAYNYRHFLSAIPFLSLLGAAGAAAVLSRLPSRYHITALTTTLVLVLLYQGFANWQGALYRANHFKQDYRESARYIAGTPELSAAVRPLLIGNVRFFDHYLQTASHGRLKMDLLLMDPGSLPQLINMLVERQQDHFYFLEAPLIPAANRMVTALDQTLAANYLPVCRNTFIRTQVIGFEKVAGYAGDFSDWSHLPACPASPQNPQ